MSDPNNFIQESRQDKIRTKIHEIIFEADTPMGALFDVSLLIAIVMSVIITCLATVAGFEEDPWKTWINVASLLFTILFTIEYALRIYCVRRPVNYIFSFWGMIDLMSVLPDYLLLFTFNSPTRAFSVIRSLRLLRVFRIFKLGWFQSEADDLGGAVWRARAKVIVFLTVVMIIVTVTGTLMYEIENIYRPDENDFDSIPEGIYWAVVTMTTVGFGDTVPKSPPGKFLSAVLILVGYSLIIVPTGFVSAEIIESRRKKITSRSCSACISEGHDLDAIHCKYCGEKL